MDGNPDVGRLETIIDSEIMDCSSKRPEPLVEFRRRVSNDECRWTTPEHNWKMDNFWEETGSNFEANMLKVKASLWLLGHAGTSTLGVEQLNNLGIIETIVFLAEKCPYYPVRATAVYVLNLIATTRHGADILTSLDWPCIRRKRGDQWQVIPPASNPFPTPSPTPIQRHHRSLSDGKTEFPESIIRRTRNRSESAATDFESRRCILL